MAVYFQHYGAKALANYQATIGSEQDGLKQFTLDDIAEGIAELTPDERQKLHTDLMMGGASTFQIWGIQPTATKVVPIIAPGDFLLLTEGLTPDSRFTYGGRILARLPMASGRLSEMLWNDPRYLVILIKGVVTSYRWGDFAASLGYGRGFSPWGWVAQIAGGTLRKSRFGDEHGLLAEILGTDLGPGSTAISDLQFDDPAELDIPTEEGRRQLRAHLQRERTRALVAEFKRRLRDFRCCVCDFDFHSLYGDLGREFIECHHTKPIALMKTGEQTKLVDLRGVCSNCHRMLHRSANLLTVEKLRALLRRDLLSH